jgi:methionyl aminopeptidase
MSFIRKEDIEKLRQSGKRLARVLHEVEKMVAPGISTRDLDTHAEKLIKENGDMPAFLNYTPHGAERPYPATLCVSVNDEVVHGIPTENPVILKEGDIVALDIGLIHEGIVTDMAVTVGVGNIDETAKELIALTKKALQNAIAACGPGIRTGDIGEAVVKTVVGNKFSIVEELGGHGVGYRVHDEPYISNVGYRGKGAKIMPGMALALEPILNEGTEEVYLSDDGYTFKTMDGKRSAHFEHTVLINETGAEVITIL